MRRATCAIATLALLGAAPAAGFAAPGEDLALRARLVQCRPGTATFTATMPAIPGSRRLSLRFDLFERAAGAIAFARVPVPTWGRWERAEPGRPGFIYTKTVQALAPGAAYRAVVRFRWQGAGGRVLRVARRVTAACRQPAAERGDEGPGGSAGG